MKPKFIVFDDDSNEVELPTKNAMCERCDGTGVHDHPAFANGITRDDFDEDEDFRESYFKGHYDVPCSICEGHKVVQIPDTDRLTPDQKRWLENHYIGQAELNAERRLRAAGVEF
jgi:hypothetical protein